MTHLRLSLLACDDAVLLPELARRLGDRVDSLAVLIDDRTTIDVESIARELWPDTPLYVAARRWDDFAGQRNALFELAREPFGDEPHQMLLLDPDSPIEGEIPDELPAPAYNVTWRQDGLEWDTPVIVRSDTAAQWIGPTHCYLALDAPAQHLPGVLITTSWVEKPGRFERDLELLEPHILTDPRSAFYYAQTLRDMHRFPEAFDAYMRRAAQGWGYAEETWCAVYEAARIVAALDEELAEVLWRRCIRLRPHRAEPYWQLARQASSRARFDEALAWASAGLRLPPSPDTLFVNRWMERDGLREQFEIASAALAPARRVRESERA